jgi:hypothetical protein
MSEAIIHCWADVPADFPMDKLERRRVIGTQAMISHSYWKPAATRSVHSETGRSVVVDDLTIALLQVGGDGFKY